MSHSFTIKPARRRAALAALAAACSTAAVAEPLPAVTPYRPGVSTPAQLSAPGWLEVEAAVQRSNGDDPQRLDTLPYSLKLAFTPDWGVRIDGNALVRQRDANGEVLRGIGDTSIVLKRHFGVDEASAFGLELGVKLPTARSGLGSDRTDVGLNGIYSRDLAEGWHTDVNLSATRFGGVEPGLGRWQKGWAAALSHSLTDKCSAAGELSGTHQSGNGSTSQALAAATYAVTPALVIDFGVSKGLNSASGGWSVFTGVTFIAARLF